MDKQHEVLLNTFVISKKRYRVFYNTGVIVWEAEGTKKDKISVPISDVLTIVLTNSPRERQCKSRRKESVRKNNSTGSSETGHSSANLDSDRIPVLSNSSSFATTATVNTTTTTATHSISRANTIDFGSTDRRESGGFIDTTDRRDGNYLIIYYAAHVDDGSNRWKVKSVVLHNSDHRVVDLWYNRLTNDIEEQNRPKSLLLFLNPYGGKKNAMHLFERYAKPLFELAKVDINLIITQRAQQIYDIVTSKTINLDNYDGLVCCGGDGTFSELFNGLVFRAMLDLGMDVNRPPYLPRPNIPLGIIPAGSTDTVAYCLNGTTDIKTSIIHIILGQQGGLDIASVYRTSAAPKDEESANVTKETTRPQLLKLYASVLSYGYLGDIAYDSEKYRWMGPKRYDYSGFKKFMKNRGYCGEIVVQVQKNITGSEKMLHDPNDGVRCVDNCQRCHCAATAAAASVVRNETSCDTEHVVIKGKFLMVNGANISCSCARSPQGFSPYCHVGDGCLDLILVRHTSMFNNLRLLLTMTSKTKKLSDLPFVEIYRTKKFYFCGNNINGSQLDGQGDIAGHDNATLEDSCYSTDGPTAGDVVQAADQSFVNGGKRTVSRWNCDGEVMTETDIVVESNCQLIKVFRRGVYCSEEDDTRTGVKASNCFGLCR